MGVTQVHGSVRTKGRPPQDMLGLGVSEWVGEEELLGESGATLGYCLCHLVASSSTQQQVDILPTFLCNGERFY